MALREPKVSKFDESGRLRRLRAHWQACANGHAIPERASLDPLGMRPWLGNVLLVDVMDGGQRFVYRLYGSEVAGTFGQDMTGRTPHEFPAHHVDIILDPYRDVVASRAPRYTAHILSIFDRKFAAWERAVLPVANAAGEVAQLLVGLYRVRITDLEAYRASLAAAGIEPVVTQEAEGTFL